MQIEAPETLTDIHPDEALLLSIIKDFIKPFKEQYKNNEQKIGRLKNTMRSYMKFI